MPKLFSLFDFASLYSCRTNLPCIQRKSPYDEPQDEVTLQLLNPFPPEGRRVYVGQEDRPPCPCSLGLARLLRRPNPQIDETTGDSTRFGLEISDQISSRQRTRFTDQVMAGMLGLRSTSSRSRSLALSLSLCVCVSFFLETEPWMRPWDGSATTNCVWTLHHVKRLHSR